MLIGLISDTHIPESMPEVPPEVASAFRGVDLILHAGDMHVIEVLDWLERIAPVLSVRGNGDYHTSWSIQRPGVPDDPRVLDNPVLDYEGFRIGMTHAFPTPDELSWENLGSIMDRFFGQSVDLIVTGDSHVERVIEEKGIMLINPGSATLPHNLMPQLGTVALLKIQANERPVAKIIDLKMLAEQPLH